MFVCASGRRSVRVLEVHFVHGGQHLLDLEQAEALVACEHRIDELEKQLARLAARLSSDEEDEGM